LLEAESQPQPHPPVARRREVLGAAASAISLIILAPVLSHVYAALGSVRTAITVRGRAVRRTLPT
jgi:hypothetical protein